MEDERAGEPLQWRNALDELTVLPGEAAIDKEAAWNRLQVRLQKKPRRKSVVPYWAAAAATLLFVMAVWWMHGKQPHGRLTDGKQLPPPATRATVPVPAPEQQAMVAVPQGVQKKSLNAPVRTKSGLRTAGAVPPPAAVIVKQDLPDLPSPAVTLPTQPSADTQHALAVLPVQKKLRIVHLNELGVAPAETPLARTAGAPYLQAKLSNTEDLSKFFITRNTSDDILKVKLSSN